MDYVPHIALFDYCFSTQVIFGRGPQGNSASSTCNGKSRVVIGAMLAKATVRLVVVGIGALMM